MSAPSRLTGRRAFVTGAASGIGAAIARRLSSEGARVIVADRDLPGALALAGQIGASAIELDLADIEATQRAVREAGTLDILVNNVGVDQHAFFTKTTIAQWHQLIAANLESVLATTHAALPAMQSARYGRIVNIASEAGRMGSRGGAVYAAAKGGVIAFTRSIARENGPYGITANVVAPGPVDTPMLRNALAAGGAKLLEAMIASTLVGRLGQPEEVAAAVAFFAAQEAAFVTGETLGVSGGMGCGA
ncbi:MAG: SDR family oxidoreductase [Burkholderiaceae bacterium]|nr:SDR family oxidoreductase [Burkholderiaceae bacterium]